MKKKFLFDNNGLTVSQAIRTSFLLDLIAKCHYFGVSLDGGLTFLKFGESDFRFGRHFVKNST